jgi:hypothetical protein
MNKDNLAQDFDATFSNLQQTIGLFDSENFNQVPFEGSWTPAQVVEHIILSSDGFSHVLNGKTADTERPYDELVGKLKEIFLNFKSKLQSPDFIKPPVKDYDREAQLNKLASIKEKGVNDISALDLSKTCLDMELPSLGKLSRLEAISFVIYHTQRHTHQLQEINKFLNLS